MLAEMKRKSSSGAKLSPETLPVTTICPMLRRSCRKAVQEPIRWPAPVIMANAPLMRWAPLQAARRRLHLQRRWNSPLHGLIEQGHNDGPGSFARIAATPSTDAVTRCHAVECEGQHQLAGSCWPSQRFFRLDNSLPRDQTSKL